MERRTVFMHMPEAAVDEHNRVVFREDDIRVSGEPFVVFAEPESLREQV